MKLIKKTASAFAILVVFLLCFLFSACRFNMTKVGEYEIFNIHSFVLYPYGVPFGYRFKNATIEMGNVSDEAMIVFESYDEIIGWDEYSYFIEPIPEIKNDRGWKKLLHEECPLKYNGATVFQWRPVNDWWVIGDNGERVGLDDYIYFIARKDDKIAGYAVIYFYTDYSHDGEDYKPPKARGEILVDSVLWQNGKKAKDENVYAKISEVIEKHKNSATQ